MFPARNISSLRIATPSIGKLRPMRRFHLSEWPRFPLKIVKCKQNCTKLHGSFRTVISICPCMHEFRSFPTDAMLRLWFNCRMDFSARIRKARRHSGMSQRALAEQLGISRGAVANWEGSRPGRPSTDNLRKMSARTGVSFEWLASGHGEMSPPPQQRRSLIRRMMSVWFDVLGACATPA